MTTVKEIPAKLVAELRAKTGAGMMDCKKALEEAGGDMEKAEELLRARGRPVRRSRQRTRSKSCPSIRPDWLTIERHIWMRSRQKWSVCPQGVETFEKGSTQPPARS